MNLVSNENNIKKWNQGGVLGRSPEGSTLRIFHIPLNHIPSTLSFERGVVMDLIIALFF